MCTLLHFLFQSVYCYSPTLEVVGGDSSLKLNVFQGNTSWPPAIRWLFFENKVSWINNNIFCVPLQTPKSGEYLQPHESLLIIWEVWRKGEGGVLIVYLMWFLSACLITALPGSSPSFSDILLLQCRPGPKQKQWIHLSVKRYLIFIWGFPIILLEMSRLLYFDFQIKD